MEQAKQMKRDRFWKPAPMEQYRHFKGGRYQVLCVAEKEDTGEKLVIYQALYGVGKIWARSLRDFASEVDQVKYPDARQQYRFEKIGENIQDDRENIQDDTDIQKLSSEAGLTDQIPAENIEEAIDPRVEQFLDARTAEEKLEILSGMRESLTDDMIDTMAMASGVEIDPGPVEERYYDLRDCLAMIDRYEMERGRLR